MRRIALTVCAAMIAACTQNEPATNDAAAVADAPVENMRGPSGDNDIVDHPPPKIDATAVSAGPCSMQGKEKLSIAPTKALGTEPFWGARIDGRCVTYSTPEDQAGTRIWTKYEAAAGGGVWTGTFQTKPFKLVTRAKADCSDGMSDRTYPLEVVLTVGGEERHGCAAPE